KGQLDTVRIWSVARTLPQILADIDRDLKGNESGLRGEWRFNEAMGSAALDSSVAQRNGTLIIYGGNRSGQWYRVPPASAGGDSESRSVAFRW
ncbi:MAG: hypothetical protein L0Z50_39455, partial [Verrucomicrobiales bacterium]|nr:hypothetical protein [Verrucomicrobiales bacterium]